MDEHAQLRFAALHRRVEWLERELDRLHEHLGLTVPERPSPPQHEVDTVRRLLAQGREEEALQLHRELTGQGTDESQKLLESLRAGL